MSVHAPTRTTWSPPQLPSPRLFLAILGLFAVVALVGQGLIGWLESPAASLKSGTGNTTPGVVPSTRPAIATTSPAVPTLAPTPATTPPPQTVFTIPVPVYQQSLALDCETAAMQQALAYFGHYYDQNALLALEQADTRPPVMGPNHTVLQWGDPYTNFVGNVNGSDWIPTGFGVYWPVILQIARTHGVPNAIGGEGFAPSTIYAALQAGDPVQVWIETRFTRVTLGTWLAWDDRPIRYSYAEHSVTLSGVSPTQVRVNDVLNGTQYWVSKALFEANFADFNNMAVIYQ